MDELPKNAKKLIAEARGAHDPPRGAQQRVWNRLEASDFGSGQALGTQGLGRGPKPALGKAAKVALTGGVIVALGGAGYLLRGQMQSPHAGNAPSVIEAPRAAQREPAPVVEDLPADAPVNTDRALSHAPAVRSHRADRRPKSAGDGAGVLSGEVSLLSAASDALAHQDIARAGELLETYRVRYPRGQMREERAGLEILRRCLLDGREAEARAEDYLRSAPRGVLRGRIQHACKLEPEL
jgi:hypothetical protein